MTPDYDAVARLRELFALGATPSRLIEYIADRHAGDSNWPRYVADYFIAAFSVALLDWTNRSPDLPIDDRMASYLNTAVLHELTERAHLWRHTLATPTPNEKAWLDGLNLSRDELSLIENIHPESHPSLIESWPTMNDETRFFIRQSMINAQSYYEKTQILARLVENLQQQVTVLEQQVEAVTVAG